MHTTINNSIIHVQEREADSSIGSNCYGVSMFFLGEKTSIFSPLDDNDLHH